MSCLHTNINADGGSCADCGCCLHEVIFGGLCALCGAIIDEDQKDDYTSNHIDMTHDASGITVSKKEAERIQKGEEARLLKTRKLSLIVDLDQTILHAAWEPHIAEWVDDHKQKRDSRAKDMSTFTLDGSKYTIKLRPGTIKFLKDMSKLYEMHVYTMGTRAYAKAVAAVIDPTMELFQDRILTRDENGSLTKKRLDRLFPADQSKVVVLDDRADVWDYSPNLIQIKPYEYFAGVGDINAPPNAQSTKLIPTEAIKEDEDVNTADVNNKEKVEVNGSNSTVNKKQASKAESKAEFKTESKAANSIIDRKNEIVKSQKDDKANSDSSSDGSDSDSSSDESDVETDDKNDKVNNEISTQESSRSESSNSQQNGDHQKKEDFESKNSTQMNSNSNEPDEEDHEQNNDTDNKVQNKVNTNTSESTNGIIKHDEDKSKKESATKEELNSTESESSNSQINGDSDNKTSPSNGISSQDKSNKNILASFNPQHEDPDRILEVINKALTDVHNEFYRRVDEGEPEPHVAIILPEIKQNVLKDCALVFSGVIPLHYRPQDASIWRMATSFGANCLEELTGKVTHLVAANAGTSKVNTARKYQKIKIVSPQWLMNSIWNFKKENETPYIIPVEDVSSEVENPEETSLDFDEEELQIDMDWSDSEIDAALADDIETDNGTSAPGSSIRSGSIRSGVFSDDGDQEMEEEDWLGEMLEGIDDSEVESDYGDVESVASASSFSSSSSKKRGREYDEEDENELPSSKRLK